MPANPKVTILITVYNGERFIAQTVDSVLKQTYDNFEFIIVNDGSEDLTGTILSNYKDERIKVIHNTVNVGVSEAANIGLKKAEGQYLARIDSDDISLPGRFAVQVNYLEEHPDIGLLGACAEVIDEQGNILPNRLLGMPGNDEDLKAYLSLDNCFVHSSVMIRTDLIREIGGYNQTFRVTEDYDLIRRLCRITRIHALSDVLVQYRQTESQMTKRFHLEMMTNAYLISWRTINENFSVSFPEKIYARFWWSRYYFLTNDRDLLNGHMLKPWDLMRLIPLWKQADKMPGRQIWEKTLFMLGLSLLDNRYYCQAVELFWILANYFHFRINSSKISTFIVRFLKSICRMPEKK